MEKGALMKVGAVWLGYEGTQHHLSCTKMQSFLNYQPHALYALSPCIWDH